MLVEAADGVGAKKISHNHMVIVERRRLLDRGMMGGGFIDFPHLRAVIEKAGYRGLIEAEIFSAAGWWKRPGDEVLRTVIARFNNVARSPCQRMAAAACRGQVVKPPSTNSVWPVTKSEAPLAR